jgi:Spy/CpxP family protein refolding chaperone
MKGRVYLYFVLTFLLGIIVGGAGMFYYGWHTGRWRRGFSKERVVNHLQHELSLSNDQVQQLNRIIDDSSQKYRQLRQQVDPQFQTLREDTDNRIRQILNPTQLEKFNGLVRQHQERARRHKGP